MSVLNLAINRQSQSLVAYKGCITSLPALFQGNVQDLRIYVVDPDPSSFLGGFVPVNMAGSGLRFAIGDTPTGTAGGPTPLALQTAFSWDPVTLSFVGNISLNVAAVDTFIGAAAAKGAYLEINLTTVGFRTTLLQLPLTLKAVVDEALSETPAMTDTYLTQAESTALFVKQVGDPGQRIVLKSANGVYGRELGVNDDGTAIDNIIIL